MNCAKNYVFLLWNCYLEFVVHCRASLSIHIFILAAVVTCRCKLLHVYFPVFTENLESYSRSTEINILFCAQISVCHSGCNAQEPIVLSQSVNLMLFSQTGQQFAFQATVTLRWCSPVLINYKSCWEMSRKLILCQMSTQIHKIPRELIECECF